jgi:hypothetical protein
MKRIVLVFAAALALAGLGCDKDKQDSPPQAGQAKSQETEEPTTLPIPRPSAIPSSTADKISAAASPTGKTGIDGGRVLFDGDKPRGGLAGDAAGVWAGSRTGNGQPKVSYTAAARPNSLKTTEPPSPLFSDGASDLRDSLNDPTTSGAKKSIDKGKLLAKAVSAASPALPSASSSAAGKNCPSGMSLVSGYCIDTYKASLVQVVSQGEKPWPYYSVPAAGQTYKAVSVAGAKPQAYISGEMAAAACSQSGKRLCSSKEWVQACKGPLGKQYPYGGQYEPHVCNEHSYPKYETGWIAPMYRLFGPKPPFDSNAAMNDPRLDQLPGTVAATGGAPFDGCKSDSGVYDMVGNLHEWVADRNGARGVFKGGYFVEAELNGHGCDVTTTAHGFSYHDYSTGFRCCADAR